ncbi:MAG TPA: esterase-like activity of phytase family protein [Aquabacterium sp.]|nr:esterase-like activity of phytase family protein [Aquabacterium sp.]
MRFAPVSAAATLAALFCLSSPAHASFDLIAVGSLGGATDLSGLTGTLESGASGSILGGMGSALAWAGGNTFLALPDRGPNATDYLGGAAVDNTQSYIPRFQTVALELTHSASGGLPYTLTPTLKSTTLLYSTTALNYGATAGLPSGVPSSNTADQFYFTGRSDAFAAGVSTNPNNARLDPEGMRVSADGKSVFISDEYGPYVYQFDRATGARIRSFALPSTFAVSTLSANGAAEIAGNTSGRVANKGMEGLSITPDGKTLFGFMQSALLQDGGDGAKANRIVSIDIASGDIHQYSFNNVIGSKGYNSSEILALNDHQFWVLQRDGKGLGDGTSAKVKQIWSVDLSGATDVSALTGEAALLAAAPGKTLVLDIKSALNAAGIADADIPSKLEGLAFGEDLVDGGQTYHTLYLANDNDFVPDVAGPNKFFVFRFTDADLAAKGLGRFNNQAIAAVPEANEVAMAAAGMVVLLGFMRRRKGN